MRSLFLISFVLLVAGCGSSSTSNTPDLAAANGSGGSGGGGGSGDMAMAATAGDMATGHMTGTDGGVLCCNDPRNTGNSVGVGKYCDTSQQCMGLTASLCATLGDPTEHFCTMLCSQGSTACGTGASCQCQNGQCGCVPDVCVTPPPGC